MTEPADETRPAADDSAEIEAPVTRRSVRAAREASTADAPKAASARPPRRRAQSRPAPKAREAKPARSVKSRVRSLASTVVVGLVVPGLFATAALPSYSTESAQAATTTSYAQASAEAQSLDVPSDASAIELALSGYSATTQEELDAAREAAEKKAAEEAAEKAAEESGGSDDTNSAIGGAIAGSGAVRWPLPGPGTIGDGFMSRGGAHHGVDILIGGGTPIGAVADGVVVVSQESYGGYGVAVVIEHSINGQTVRTTYGHMTYGTRTVSVGQTVTAGQIIGLVGSTGRSTANHLHLEVTINGTLVDPLAWLRANGAY